MGKPGIEISFKEGINLITGINNDKDSRNGVGKSTIIESLYWCLFGDTMREIKKDQVVNNINKKECAVSLNFTITSDNESKSYLIIREAKPSKVTIYENEVDITKSTLAKADNYITTLINATGEVFQNAVIMTANNTTPFMAQKKGDKRKFIEDMLRLSVFGEMAVLLRNDFADTKKSYEVNFDKKQTTQTNLKIYEEQQDKQNCNKIQRIEEIRNRIADNSEEIKESEKNIAIINEEEYCQLNESIKKLPSLINSEKSTYKIQTKASHELEFQIKQKKEQLNKLKDNECFCYACNQELPASHKQKIDKEKIEIIEEIKILEKKHEKIYGLIYTTNAKILELENKLTQEKDALHKLDLIKNDNENKRKKIQQLKKWNDQLLNDISTIEKEENNFAELIELSSKQLTEILLDVDKLQHKLRVLDSARFVVSEEGVKSFIVKKMLQLLNNKLNFYLNKLEAPCRCFFNEFFEEIIINDRGEECSYFNFSGGERKRIDLAVLFMFQDIRRLQSDVFINLSMYDELFDSALDERGAECILSLLKERVELNNESIYIVTHNKNTVKADINSVLQLQKTNGLTTLLCE